VSFQRRAYDMDLGRRDHTRWLGSSGRYSTRLTLPTTNLLAAWDARVGVTNVSGACSAWADQSGNGWNASQGTAGSRPTITTTGGFPSLLFDGTSHWLGVPGINAAAGVKTLYVVQNATSTPNNYRVFWDSTTGRLQVGGGSVGAGPQYSVFDGADRNSGVTVTTGLSRLTYQHGLAGGMRFWRNGVAATPVAVVANKPIGGVSVIGSHNSGAASFYPGHILFLAIYTAARNTAVEDYITQEWGV